MTQVIQDLNEWRQIRKKIDKELGLVPTMGNLHEGHLSLMQRAHQENALTVLSIFVNPTQFNQANDYVHYPRTLEQDLALAQKAKIDYVLAPRYQDIYPDDYAYQVNEQEFSELLEGAHRPGHFSGMLTIVTKLLILTQATRAYFGEKDFQQLQLVRGLVQAFFLDTEIIACPTIRTDFGLPQSSRNRRLTPEQYEQARQFPAIFHSDQSCADIKSQLEQAGFAVDYIEENAGRRFAAVKLGDIRLIDNIQIGEGE